VTIREKSICPDCSVEPGQLHVPGCDIEPCPACGGQAISCPCPGKNGISASGSRRVPWNGEWPGKAECREFGWYARRAPVGWETCSENDAGAREDLNRLHGGEARWDRTAQRWVRNV
jgi:hypothetical protein